MKILLINHFPLAGSGSGTYTKNLAISLANQGHEVTIILPENTVDYEDVPGVRLKPVFFTPEDGSEAPTGALPFNFPCFTTHPRSTYDFGSRTKEETELYLDAFNKVLDEEILKNRPDVIHGQHIWMLSSLAAGKGIPLVLTAHGTDLMGYDRWPEFRIYAKRAMDAASAVISISKDNLELVKERFPEAENKIIMMRNGYDPGVFHPSSVSADEVLEKYGLKKDDYEGKRIVIFAGKLTHAKGVDVLLRAAKLYESQAADTITLIVGDGEEMSSLRSLAAELELKSVRFLGNVDQKALCDLYNVSDVDMVPSRKEAFGLVALEAMACGIPVIASREGGLPDFVKDEVGCLVEPEDHIALSEAVLKMLDREKETDFTEWRKRIHDYARENYAQDKIIHELVGLYESIIR